MEVLSSLVGLALAQRDAEQALSVGLRTLEEVEVHAFEKRELIAVTSFNTGIALLWLARPLEAESYLRRSLVIGAEADWPEGIGYPLEVLAATALARGCSDRAARLLGAVETLREEASFSLDSYELEMHDQTVAGLRSTLGEDAFARLVAEGRALTRDEAVRLGLEEPPVTPSG